jgi:hypothetical protein
MDEIGAHMDERKVRTDEKGGVHRWRDNEGGACGGAQTPWWGHARLEMGRARLVEGARTPRGGAYAWEGGVYTWEGARMPHALEEGAYAWKGGVHAWCGRGAHLVGGRVRLMGRCARLVGRAHTPTRGGARIEGGVHLIPREHNRAPKGHI